MVLLYRRKVDGLVQFLRQALKERACHRDKVAAHGRREPQDRGPEPHAAVWRRCDDKLFRFECRNDALHGRAREVHALRNLAKAQAAVFLFQCAQNGGRPRNHLHLAFFVGHQTIHYVSHPQNMPVFKSPCIVGHDSPKSDTAKSEKMKQAVWSRRGNAWSRRSRSRSISWIRPQSPIGGRQWSTSRPPRRHSFMRR